tara:strand:- start:101 stop:394 length:294 start_codon:yes stop_codon:yes gene_type:complete
MARKISGPFNNVTIQTIGHMGSTSMYNDDFSKIVLDQMAIFSQSDELSAIHLTDFVDKMRKRLKQQNSKKTNRLHSKKQAPIVDLIGPENYAYGGLY